MVLSWKVCKAPGCCLLIVLRVNEYVVLSRLWSAVFRRACGRRRVQEEGDGGRCT